MSDSPFLLRTPATMGAAPTPDPTTLPTDGKDGSDTVTTSLGTDSGSVKDEGGVKDNGATVTTPTNGSSSTPADGAADQSQIGTLPEGGFYCIAELWLMLGIRVGLILFLVALSISLLRRKGNGSAAAK